jgi:hypothetical protein
MKMIIHFLYDLYSQTLSIEKQYNLFNKGKINYFEDDSVFLYRSPHNKKIVAFCVCDKRCIDVSEQYQEFVKISIDSDKKITYNDFEVFKFQSAIA